jgi:hypothetical protein
MQIHEITRSHLREGVMSSILKAIPNVASGFVQGASGVDFPRQIPQDSLDKATRDRARQLALKWEEKIKTQKNQKPAGAAQAKSSATTQAQPVTPATRSPAEIADMKAKGFDPTTGQKITPGTIPSAGSTQPIMLGGKRLDPKNPNDAKVLAAMQSQGKLEEAPQEYTTPSGVIVPGGTTTDPKSLGTVDFEQWADQQLTTQVSGTGQPIDLDAVKKDPAVKSELDKVIPQIKKDPANIAAVEMYFLTAMKGMQRMAAQARQSAGIDPNATAPSANPLSKIINDQQLTAIKNLVQNPQTTAAIKQALGIK